MLALRLHGREDLRLEDIPLDEPMGTEVTVRVSHNGICGSDLHAYFRPESAGLRTGRRHPLTGATLPQVLGHEMSGEVVTTGPLVERARPGDRVVVRPIYACGDCDSCTAGSPNACASIAFHGLQSHGGGMAEFTTVPERMLHVLPPSLSLQDAALVEPMAVAWHAVEIGHADDQAPALVLGGGPIGIGVWFALRARGIETIAVSEPSPARRAVLAALGVEHLLDPTVDDVGAVVRELTGGRGVSVAVDAAGVGAAVEQGLTTLAPRGRLVVAGVHERPFSFNPSALVRGEKQLVGSLAYTESDFDSVIRHMAAGHYDLKGWVETVSLGDVEGALMRLRRGEAMKLLVSPSTLRD